ncbi:MAG: hypothetical protein QOF76_3866 [Solirubrobacteraceae bacterium]|jgi:steroid delta-isomerase-like uncharacterized protein|nr:hypothetical protein [Solirubrobacteraceae bacterium]
MTDSPFAVAQRYFEATGARDVDAMVACWADGGRENIRDQADLLAPQGVREFFTAMFTAFPDMRFEVVHITADDERAVVRWEATGTFASGDFGGFAATGQHIRLEGIDELTVRDGLIVENNAWADSVNFARQIGAMPPVGSRAESVMTGALNTKTKLARWLVASGPDEVADGVWLVRGGFPVKTMNVYLVRDGDGVLAFDAGIVQMTAAVRSAAAELGGLTRVVLGHAHADHRGSAPGAGVDVFCHEDDRLDAEGDGGEHYFQLSKLPPHGRPVFRKLLPYWDGGPVSIAGTLAEGDEVAGFEVVHLPGHAPGLIALHRKRDGVVLSSDCFYTIDPLTGVKGEARVPHAAFNQDTEIARGSIRKLAALAPRIAFPGHADPVTGDVTGELQRAAG